MCSRIVERHMSAEDIHTELKKHTNAINLATVYRTLDMLWEEDSPVAMKSRGKKLMRPTNTVPIFI